MLPCKKGENITPFNPSGKSGIMAPVQFSKNPQFCNRYPIHIKDNMMKGAIIAFLWMPYFILC